MMVEGTKASTLHSYRIVWVSVLTIFFFSSVQTNSSTCKSVHLCRAAHQTLFSSSGYFWRLKCSESDDIRLVIAFNSQPRPVRKCDAARDWRKTNGRLVTSVAFDAAACVLPERKRARGLLSSTTSIGVVCFSARRCASALLTIALRPSVFRQNGWTDWSSCYGIRGGFHLL